MGGGDCGQHEGTDDTKERESGTQLQAIVAVMRAGPVTAGSARVFKRCQVFM